MNPAHHGPRQCQCSWFFTGVGSSFLLPNQTAAWREIVFDPEQVQGRSPFDRSYGFGKDITTLFLRLHVRNMKISSRSNGLSPNHEASLHNLDSREELNVQVSI